MNAPTNHAPASRYDARTTIAAAVVVVVAIVATIAAASAPDTATTSAVTAIIVVAGQRITDTTGASDVDDRSATGPKTVDT